MDGGGYMEHHHSLPEPDSTRSNHNNHNNGRKTLKLAIAGCVALLGLIIGFSVGMGGKKKNQSSGFNEGFSDISHLSMEERQTEYTKYLVDNSVSKQSDFDETTSPQARAVRFLAQEEDNISPHQVPHGTLKSKTGYSFATRYIMALLYYATNGASWENDLNFLSTDKSVCEWNQVMAPPLDQQGVICSGDDDDEIISGLSFVNQGLDGVLPSELGLLSTLVYIESVQNKISGSFPAEMARLTNLETLIFPFNQIAGPMPEWISSIHQLKFLYLSNNALTGSIASNYFDSLSNLDLLALDHNQFTGSLDFLWNTNNQQLSNLRYIYLDDNQFTGQLPSSMAGIGSKFVHLDLSNNAMDGSLSTDILDLPVLQTLDLHDNEFTGAIPHAERHRGGDGDGSDHPLEFLSLNQNQLSQTIPNSIGNLQSLQHLDLSQNTLTGDFPPSFAALSKLTYLFLAENPFTMGTIPNLFYSLKNLKELSLKSTNRNGELNDLIGLWEDMLLLDLDDNELHGTIPPQIGNLKKLQFLLLNRNKFSGNIPVEFDNLVQLRFVLLDQNDIIGDLDIICDNDVDLLGADCLEVDCGCCEVCCYDNEPANCHDYDSIPTLDPVWSSGYERPFFNFSSIASSTADGYYVLDDDTV